MPTEKEEKEAKSMDNLLLYNKVREVPKDAQKSIGGGRLKGMTDINPMWRIKALTEQFGVCGVGWYPEIIKMWLEPGNAGVVAAFVEIKLYIKVNGEWSKGIPGVGGSTFIAKESGGLYTSDECYKMAFTDAISVSCKELGFGADIYWNADRTKYDNATDKSDDGKKETPKEKTKEEIEFDNAIKETRELGSKLTNLGYQKADIQAIASKFNDGKPTMADIKTIDVCNLVLAEFKKMLENKKEVK